METMEAIARRKSTRTFDPDKAVPEELITRVLQAGCQAAIAGKPGESLHLTVCRNKEIFAEINQIATAAMKLETPMNFCYDAPCVIFVSASPEQMFPSIEAYNAACVVENMLIAATDAGLANIYLWGAVHMMANNKDLCARMGIPEGFTPLSAIAIGYDINGEAQPRELSVSLGVNYI